MSADMMLTPVGEEILKSDDGLSIAAVFAIQAFNALAKHSLSPTQTKIATENATMLRVALEAKGTPIALKLLREKRI